MKFDGSGIEVGEGRGRGGGGEGEGSRLLWTSIAHFDMS